MIVLGVDPGVGTTGYGVVEESDDQGRALLECGAIRPSAQRPLAERLLEIFEGVSQVIERRRPDVVSVEGVFYGQNVKTTLILGHAGGAVMLAAALHGIPVAEYPPAQVKSAVAGSGVARKEQVALMIQKHLNLHTPPGPADAADGVAVALCHLFRSGLATRKRVGAKHGVGRKLRLDQPHSR